MWKTALIALVAVGLASPCDAAGPAAYRVLRSCAELTRPTEDPETGFPDFDVPPEATAALERLGIVESTRPPGPLTRFFTWIGLRTAPAPVAPGMLATSILRLPDDRVVVACTPGMYSIPGRAWAALHVVDAAGRVTKTGPFSAGYRCMFPQVSLLPAARFDGLGVIVVAAAGMGGSPGRQFCVLRDNRFVLVRLEDPATGEIRKNHYGAPNFTVGPDLPDLDAAGWRAHLASDDPLTLLEALVWLGGVHLDVHREPPDWWHEDVAKAHVWDEVVTDERTTARLRELATSSDPWIAEAARGAMKAKRYP